MPQTPIQSFQGLIPSAVGSIVPRLEIRTVTENDSGGCDYELIEVIDPLIFEAQTLSTEATDMGIDSIPATPDLLTVACTEAVIATLNPQPNKKV